MKYYDVALKKEDLENICKIPLYIEKQIDNDEDLTRFAYSNSFLIKKMFCYPSFLDICVGIEHGVFNDEFQEENIIQDIEIALYGRKRQKEVYYGIKLINIEYPFLFYKKKYNIKQKKNAKGTIVFPIHGSLHISRDYDVYKYIKELKNLPDKFHPLLICLHYSDVLKGNHHIWYEAGFEVTTAGNGYREEFVKDFYNILTSVKYATANESTSSLFYAVDLDIPFFLYGNRKIDNVLLHTNVEKYAQDIYKEDLAKKYFIEEHFGEITTSISKEQKKFVNYILGKNEQKENRIKVSAILYREWLKAKIKELKRFLEVKKLQKYKKYLTYNILTHMSEVEQLSLIKYSYNKIVVEVGSFLGSNTVSLLKVAQYVYAIDDWKRHQQFDAFEIFTKNIKEYTDKLKVYNEQFERTYNEFNISVDVLIVDGEHYSVEVIRRDLSLFKNLKVGGVLIVHHKRWSPYVKIALSEFEESLEDISCFENLFVGIKVES